MRYDRDYLKIEKKSAQADVINQSDTRGHITIAAPLPAVMLFHQLQLRDP